MHHINAAYYIDCLHININLLVHCLVSIGENRIGAQWQLLLLPQLVRSMSLHPLLVIIFIRLNVLFLLLAPNRLYQLKFL